MENVKLWDLVEWTRGEPNFSREYNPQVLSVVSDSRQVIQGAAYVALKGEHVDGHNYVKEILQKGNSPAAFVTEYQGPGPQVKVKSTYLCLGDMARVYLKRYPVPRVALTGSSGKTTTKDMIYACMAQNYNTLCNEGNLNTEVGLPLTAFRMTREIQWGIFEMGMQTPGEIDYLAEIVRPQVALITNIGTAHLEYMKTQENIFKAKMEITHYLQAEDTLILNADDPYLQSVLEKKQSYQTVGYGFSKDADVRCISYKVVPSGTRIKAVVFGEEVEYELPLFGRYNVLNSLGALAVAHVTGCSLEKSIHGLRQIKLSALRMEIQTIGEKWIVNDTYNANVESMKAALEMLRELDKEAVIQGYGIPAGENRKVAILGSMGELGESSQDLHLEIGRCAAASCDLLIAVGDQARYIAQGAEEKPGNCNIRYFKCKEEAMRSISSLLHAGDLVLLKASRSQQMELLLSAIQ